VAESTSAEVKVNNSNTEFSNILKLAREHINIGDPNTTGLIQIARGLKAELDKTINEKLEIQKQLDDQMTRFEDAYKANFEKEQTLLAEKEKLMQQVADIEQKKKLFGNLKKELEAPEPPPEGGAPALSKSEEKEKEEKMDLSLDGLMKKANEIADEWEKTH